jgi:hypothetical protein
MNRYINIKIKFKDLYVIDAPTQKFAGSDGAKTAPSRSTSSFVIVHYVVQGYWGRGKEKEDLQGDDEPC